MVWVWNSIVLFEIILGIWEIFISSVWNGIVFFKFILVIWEVFMLAFGDVNDAESEMESKQINLN